MQQFLIFYSTVKTWSVIYGDIWRWLPTDDGTIRGDLRERSVRPPNRAENKNGQAEKHHVRFVPKTQSGSF